jgi:hypothetical protein
MTEQEFLTYTQGREDLVTRAWPALHEISDHTHPFALRALVTQGQMWLTHNGNEQMLEPGACFELDYAEPHAERYGPQGATYLVALIRTPGASWGRFLSS